MRTVNPVRVHARLWPRELLNCLDGKKLVMKQIPVLCEPGVYVLYSDRTPFYVGKATTLRKRLYQHNQPKDRYYGSWNNFSVFVIKNSKLRTAFEGVLIAAMPTANGAKPKFPKAKLDPSLQRVLHELRQPKIQLKAKAAGAF